jgi:hypothetical protein
MKKCITILSRGDLKTLKELKQALDSLYEKYINQFPCDMVIFHEDDFPDSFKEQATKKYKNIFFKLVEFKPPKHLTQENLNFKDPTPFLGMSYRTMCYFYAMKFYEYLEEYDWYWRLDVDSIILNKIGFDVFDYLENNNKVYGYVAQIPEHPPVIKGFGKFTTNYLKKYNVKGKFTDYLLDEKGEYNCKMIYNNFEICKLSNYKNPEAKRFLEEINKTGAIYEYRWGDAPIRTMMLSLITDRSQIHRFSNIDYHHQEYIQKDGIIDCKYVPEDWIKNNDFIALPVN